MIIMENYFYTTPNIDYWFDHIDEFMLSNDTINIEYGSLFYIYDDWQAND